MAKMVNYFEEIILSLEEYKCSICSNFLKDPVLTRCGHIFCNSCIIAWFEKKKSCPLCNKDLELDCDVFPDKRTNRAITQLKLPCLNTERGCMKTLSPYDMDHHLANCCYKMSKSADNNNLLCYFLHLGCDKEFKEEKELQVHLTEFAKHHLHILLEENEKLKEQLTKNKAEMEILRTALEEKESKITELEDQLKNSEDFKENVKLLNQKLDQLPLTMVCQNKMYDNQNGCLIWIIDDIKGKIEKFDEYYDGPEFYTSPMGYKFQVSMQRSTEYADYVGFYVELLKSENDYNLEWPCNVDNYTITTLHPEKKGNNFSKILSNISNECLMRPIIQNEDFGYPDYISKDNLAKFIKDNKLMVEIKVILK